MLTRVVTSVAKRLSRFWFIPGRLVEVALNKPEVLTTITNTLIILIRVLTHITHILLIIIIMMLVS